MKIGIIGSSEVGQTLGAAFLSEGHSVLLGTRNPSKEEVVKWKEAHPGVQTGLFAAAAEFGEIVVLAVAGAAAEEAIEPLSMLWCIPGFARNQWTHAFKLLKM
jgi:predicted dinucleotide-binding enzyme